MKEKDRLDGLDVLENNYIMDLGEIGWIGWTEFVSFRIKFRGGHW